MTEPGQPNPEEPNPEEPNPEEPNPEENLTRAEELLERLDEARSRLEAATDPDQAIEILSELSEIAKDVEAEIARAKRDADAQP